MQVVWFKRDLRTEDNAALTKAAQQGPILPLFILEPELWQQPDLSHRQYAFLQDSLRELDISLQALGQGLIIKIGDAVQVLQEIHAYHRIQALWSHQETWNNWTYQRDKKVKQWTTANNIPWHEPTQHGVIRRLKNRDGWAAHWYKQMKQPTYDKPPKLQPIMEKSAILPTADKLGLKIDEGVIHQQGGRVAGQQLLESFLYERGEHYTKAMSSPVTAFDSCSRLSPHIAFGTLSIREIFQALELRQQAIKKLPYGNKGKWPSALRSFAGRLRWHCHFIQKLEDEPRIEFENMHPAYNTLRNNDFNQQYFAAWQAGKTGYPMVDACMRALIATGWLNFRMRAMLMSFASYHLWLHWREPALHLARLFTDYEPGIHYSQVQMQSGTTGINSIRIYNPIKQSMDHDPDGQFIRQWIPELAHKSPGSIHTPWIHSSQMNGYPMPIIDEKIARKVAAAKLYELRKNMEHKAIAAKIVDKHGSRKSGLPKIIKKEKETNSKQGELPF
ncbi:MAG: FAD-binding domain-containing protein [Gammaproteobacteria bacterium]